jgi:hypothetical protein
MRQCVPAAGSCRPAPCADDAGEDNDSRAQADLKPALPAGEHSLISCPSSGGSGDDEDWFELVVAEDTTVTIEVAGGEATDLDLALHDGAGELLTSSTSFDSTEAVTACLAAGSSYARVYAWGSGGRNPYTIGYATQAGSCAAACEPDAAEDDGGAARARPATIRPDAFEVADQSICADDEDWYRIALAAGETLTADLTFAQLGSNQDLDLHIFDAGSVDLTPCSPASPSTCDLDNGQSGDADEHMVWIAPASCDPTCTFFVVVRGFGSATNPSYDLELRGTLP